MDIGSLVASLGADIRDLKKGINLAEKQLKGYAKQTDKELDKTDKRWKKSGSSIEGTVKKIGSAIVMYFSVDAIRNVTKEIVLAGIRIQSLENAFKAVSGTMQAARAELDFVKRTAHDLGLNLMALEDSFKTLAAASMKTKLEGQGARDVFYAVAEASSAMQLSATQTHASLYALQQMMSKGRVQTEELRRQLGEQLPGAFQMAAEAMEVTTAELNKMLELGLVVSEDFLPKFAKVLDERFGAAAVRNAELARGAFNRFGNAVEQLKRTMAESGILEFFEVITKASTKMIEALDASIKGKTLFDQMKDLKAEEMKLLDLRKRSSDQRELDLSILDRIGNKASDIYTHLHKNNVEFKSTIEELSGFTVLEFEKTEKGIDRISRLDKGLLDVRNRIGTVRDTETILRLASAKEGVDNIENLELSLQQVVKLIKMVDKKNTEKSYAEGLKEFAELWTEIHLKSKELTLDSYDYELMMLDRSRTAYEGHGISKLDIDKWYYAELEKLRSKHEIGTNYAAEVEATFYKKEHQELYKDMKEMNKVIGDESRIGSNKLIEIKKEEKKKLKEHNEGIAEDWREQHQKMYKDMQKMNKLIGNESYLLAKTMEERTLDALKEIEKTLKNVFKNIEDALVDFVMTGKFEFRSFALSVIEDIARIQAKALTSSLLGGEDGGLLGKIGTSLSSWLGGLGGTGYMTPTGGSPSGSMMPSFDTGGLMSSTGAKKPFPAIVHSGEVVGTPNQMSDMYGGEGGGKITNIYINAIDTQTFNDYVRKNPEGIVTAIDENITSGGQLRSTIGGTL